MSWEMQCPQRKVRLNMVQKNAVYALICIRLLYPGHKSHEKLRFNAGAGDRCRRNCPVGISNMVAAAQQ